MTTVDQAREIALAMPEAEEKGHQGHPDFRVRNRIFMTLWPDENRVVLKVPVADQTALVAADPDTFGLPGWAHQGWTGVRLDRVDPDRFRELVAAAWRHVAGPRLAAVRTPPRPD